MSKSVWDAYHTLKFSATCVWMDEVNLNNWDGVCVSRKGYKFLEDRFAKKTGDRLVNPKGVNTSCSCD
jgi:hypothetical protein